MSRGPDRRINDILAAIDRCQRYLPLLTGKDKTLAEMAGAAIERNLQIIGEAAKALPAEVTEQKSDVPWPQIRGLRNILVHQHFGIDAGVIREVVEVHLPVLADALRQP